MAIPIKIKAAVWGEAAFKTTNNRGHFKSSNAKAQCSILSHPNLIGHIMEVLK